MPWPCAKSTARDLERLIKEWNPVQTAPLRDPLLNLDAQALDPHSELAKQLRALGWTPPVAGAQPETVVGAQQHQALDREVRLAVTVLQKQLDQPMPMDQQPSSQEGQTSAPMPFSFAMGVSGALLSSFASQADPLLSEADPDNAIRPFRADATQPPAAFLPLLGFALPSPTLNQRLPSHNPIFLPLPHRHTSMDLLPTNSSRRASLPLPIAPPRFRSLLGDGAERLEHARAV